MDYLKLQLVAASTKFHAADTGRTISWNIFPALVIDLNLMIHVFSFFLRVKIWNKNILTRLFNKYISIKYLIQI